MSFCSLHFENGWVLAAPDLDLTTHELGFDLLPQELLAAGDDLLAGRCQLAGLGIDDLVFLFDAQRQIRQRHAADSRSVEGP